MKYYLHTGIAEGGHNGFCSIVAIDEATEFDDKLYINYIASYNFLTDEIKPINLVHFPNPEKTPMCNSAIRHLVPLPEGLTERLALFLLNA